MGASRNYLQSDEDEAEQRRAYFIQSRRVGCATGVKGQGSCTLNNVDISERNQDSAVGNPRSGCGAVFRPRDKVETVRNCAALPRDFVEAVVLQVATALLNMTAQDSLTEDWNPGGKDRSHSEEQSQCFYCQFLIAIFRFCVIPRVTETQLTTVIHPKISSTSLSSIPLEAAVRAH